MQPWPLGASSRCHYLGDQAELSRVLLGLLLPQRRLYLDHGGGGGGRRHVGLLAWRWLSVWAWVAGPGVTETRKGRRKQRRAVTLGEPAGWKERHLAAATRLLCTVPISSLSTHYLHNAYARVQHEGSGRETYQTICTVKAPQLAPAAPAPAPPNRRQPLLSKLPPSTGQPWLVPAGAGSPSEVVRGALAVQACQPGAIRRSPGVLIVPPMCAVAAGCPGSPAATQRHSEVVGCALVVQAAPVLAIAIVVQLPIL